VVAGELRGEVAGVVLVVVAGEMSRCGCGRRKKEREKVHGEVDLRDNIDYPGQVTIGE
jgi:hypothetical protein